MKLFNSPYSYRNSSSPMEDILKELSLFKQNNYCYEYIKKQVPGKDDEEIAIQAEISASSFRQAFEFLNSANLSYITTSPLLYSYCLNSFAKALINLYDPSLNKYFKKHGFVVMDKNLESNLLNSLITVEKSGAVTAILTLLGNHVIEKQNISFRELLEHIPEISDIYLKTTHLASSIGRSNGIGNYEMESENWEEDLTRKKEILEYFHLNGSYYGRTKIFTFGSTLMTSSILRETNNLDNFYYKDNIILPIKLKEGIYSINIMVYSYLILMGYGMIVRYNADKWEKFIDPKTSNEASLISESISQCINIFITHVHKILFGYTYETLKYSDQKVKQVINESTRDIMANIKKELQDEARINRSKPYLPW